jgi:hypothetical protein
MKISGHWRRSAPVPKWIPACAGMTRKDAGCRGRNDFQLVLRVPLILRRFVMIPKLLRFDAVQCRFEKLDLRVADIVVGDDPGILQHVAVEHQDTNKRRLRACLSGINLRRRGLAWG